jgi:hypothetical protein
MIPAIDSLNAAGLRVLNAMAEAHNAADAVQMQRQHRGGLALLLADHRAWQARNFSTPLLHGCAGDGR